MRQFRSLAITCAVGLSVLAACGSSGGGALNAPGDTTSNPREHRWDGHPRRTLSAEFIGP